MPKNNRGTNAERAARAGRTSRAGTGEMTFKVTGRGGQEERDEAGVKPLHSHGASRAGRKQRK